MINNISSLQKLSTRNFDIKLRFTSVALPIVVICIGCIVICNWYFDLPILKNIFPGRVTMNVSTALSFILSSTSLLVWHFQHHQQISQPNQTKNIFNLFISGYLCLVPSLLILFTIFTLIEYGFQVNLGTDFFLPESFDALDVAVGGKISPNTALCFFWFNGAVLLLIQKYYLAVQLSAVAIIAIALTSLIGHIYDLSAFYGMNSGTGMAVHTALSFILLALALLNTRADKSLMRVISIDEAGGMMARWLLPLVTVIPPFLGWFFWWNFTDIEIALETRIALSTLVEIAILDGIVLWTAQKLNEIDRQRQKLFCNLKESEQQLRLAFDRAVIGKALVSLEGRFLKVNPALCQLIGYSETELLQLFFRDITYPEDLDADLEFVRQVLADEISNYQIEKRYIHKSGRIVWILLSVSLVTDEKGRPKYFVSQIQDITARKQAKEAISRLNEELEARVKQRTTELETTNQSLIAEIIERQRVEEEIRLLQNITQAIAAATDFEEAIAVTLRQVCETGGWHFAEAWIPSRNETMLQLSSTWYSTSVELLSFREASTHFSFSPNAGLPGRVWATKQFEWIQNISSLSETVFQRVQIAQNVGFKTALGVPIVASDKVIAVFVFFDLYDRSENKRMVELVRSIAAQLGLIMERKKVEDALRSSMATNRALLHAIPDWIFRFGYDGTLINFKAPKNTHVPLISSRFMGKRLDEVLPSEVAEVMMKGISEALTTKKVRVCEYQLSRKLKSKDYEARIAVSDSNEVMAIVRDITERKQVEQNIRQALEQEKHLNELKTRFVTMTSHEFRTPLASILSSSELLEHYSHKWNEAKKLNHLHRIQTSVKHMTNLLNDVLLLGKADAGKLELSPTQFELYQFCQEYVEEMQLITETHQIVFSQGSRLNESAEETSTDPIELVNKNPDALSGDRDYSVYMDEKLLRHILNNLLSNAIKYSPDSDKVYFNVQCEPKQATFQVRDLGIGIPLEEQERLFDSFHRFSNVNSIPGTGLGLPIVKRAVDLHGGTIVMDSKIGNGTTFTVTLPNLAIE